MKGKREEWMERRRNKWKDSTSRIVKTEEVLDRGWIKRGKNGWNESRTIRKKNEWHKSWMRDGRMQRVMNEGNEWWMKGMRDDWMEQEENNWNERRMNGTRDEWMKWNEWKHMQNMNEWKTRWKDYQDSAWWMMTSLAHSFCEEPCAKNRFRHETDDPELRIFPKQCHRQLEPPSGEPPRATDSLVTTA